MNKYFEPFMWTVCGIAILVVGLSDPLTWEWITEHWLLILVVTLLLAFCGAVSFLCGYHKGKLIGHTKGFQIGMRWK